MNGYPLVRSDILSVKTAASFSHSVSVDTCLPKIISHCSSYIAKPSNWKLCKGHQFDFPGHDLLFLQRMGLEQLYGAETQWSGRDFRGNGQLELLEAQIFLVSGAFEEHKARNLDPGSGSFVRESLGPALFARNFWPRLL